MRKILLGTLVVAGLGIAGLSTGSAAPVNNTAVKAAADQATTTTQVGWHGPYRSHWRWGSRGGGRCHVRWRSWWRFC